MIEFLSFEYLKLVKRWMPRIIVLLLLALTVLAFWAGGTRHEGRIDLLLPRGWLTALIFCSYFAPFFWPVLGGSWAGNEYGWGTIRTILTRRPQRVEHILAALVVLLATIAVTMLAILVVATIAGAVVAALTGNSAVRPGLLDAAFVATLVKGALTAWFVSAFYLLLAYVAAIVFRSAAVGIGLGIGLTLAQLVLRGIFAGFGGIWRDIALHFPFSYTDTMITRVVGGELASGTGLARVSSDAPSAGQSVVAILIYAAILLAIGLVAVKRRDVTA